MLNRLIIAALLLLNLSANAQTRVTDSLRHLLYKAAGDARLPILLALGKEQHSLNRDSAYQYAKEAMGLAGEASPEDKAMACLYFSQSYIPWGWVDSAMAVLQPALQNVRIDDPGLRELYFQVQRQEAMIYGVSTRYKEALDILYRLVGEATHYNDSVTVSENMNSIASIALARNEPAEAGRWLHNAILFSVREDRYIPVHCAIFINLASTFLQLDQPDSANYYLKKAIPVARQIEDLRLLATAYRVQINISVQLKQINQAEEAFQELQEIKSKTDVSNVADDNIAIAEFYITSNQLQKAIDFCEDILAHSAGANAVGNDTGVKALAIRLQFYEKLAKATRLAGNTTLYTQTLEKIIGIKDSVFQASSANEISEIRTKYETQLKENSIIQQQAFDLTRKNYLFYGLLGFLVLAIATGAFVFYEEGRRQKIKMAMVIQEEKKLSEDAVRQAEENERIRIAADLHDNLGAYAASLSSNLNYIPGGEDDDAVKNAVQQLKTNSAAMIAELNDTIWALKKESLSLTAISDRVKIFTNRFRRSYPGISIEVTEEITNDILFSPSQAFHIYRVIQESFNNAIRHSKGDVIEIRFYSDMTWKIEVADNGTGINKEKTGTGNGLENLKKRCTDNHWKISWHDATPGGTVVRITPTAN